VLPLVGAPAGGATTEDADPIDERRAWTAATDADAPALATGPDGERAYRAGHAGDGDAGGALVEALDAATGEIRWSAERPDGGAGYAAASDLEVGPAGDRVLAAGAYRTDYGEQAPFAVALDARTGDLLWSLAPEPSASTTAAGLAVPGAGDRALLATWSPDEGTVRAHSLDLATGHVHGSLDLAGELAPGAQPLAWTGAPDRPAAHLLAATDDGLTTLAVNATAGEVRWTATEAGAYGDGWPLVSPRAVATPAGDGPGEGLVVVAAAAGPPEGPRQARLMAYDAGTGEPAWRRALNAPEGAVADPVALAVDEPRGRVVATVAERSPAAPDGLARTVAVEAADGTLAWSHREDAIAHPADLALDHRAERAHVTGWTADEAPRPATLSLAAADGTRAWTHVGEGPARGLDAAVTPDAARVLVAERAPDAQATRTAALDTGVEVEVDVTPDRQRRTAGPLGEERHPVEAANVGSLPATVEPRVTGLDDGWTAYLERDGQPVDTVDLDPGARAELDLAVVPPRTSLAGSSWANLTLEPQAAPVAAGHAATLTTVEATGGLSSPTAPARAAPPCAWARDHAGTAPGDPTACEASAEPVGAANATVAAATGDPARGSHAADDDPLDRPEDARVDRWWTGLEDHVTPAPDEPSGPDEFDGTWDRSRNRTWPGDTVHATLLPDGNVLYHTGLGGGFVWDPVQEYKVADRPTNTWLFCSGMALLPDGDLYAPGGTTGIFPFVGARTAERFDAQGYEWSQVANMTHERWYPTAVTLGSGDVGVLTGLTHDEANGTFIIEPAVTYDAEADAYADAGSRLLPTYSKAYSLPSGEVFVTSPDTTSLRWDPDAGTFHDVAEREGPLRIGGGSALLDAATGSVLEFGGGGGDAISFGDGVTDHAEVFDPDRGSWREVEPMHHARLWPDAVLLPDGDVLALGGAAEEHDHDHDAGGHDGEVPLPVETYDPEAATWIEGPAPETPMAYHSTALLLPDGRVLSVNQHENDPQFFEPWYLQVEDRPEVLEAPEATSYGVPATLVVDEPGGVDEVHATRHSAVTHSLNTEQRRLPLDTVTWPGHPAARVLLPGNPSYAPPGYYMVFAVDDGVPAEAPSFRLTDGPLGVPDRPPRALGPPAPSDPAGAHVDDVVEAQLDEHERHGGAHDHPGLDD
jgi:outer membrane protein assembly factor BamB